jgi:hypothetical protein
VNITTAKTPPPPPRIQVLSSSDLLDVEDPGQALKYDYDFEVPQSLTTDEEPLEVGTMVSTIIIRDTFAIYIVWI